MTWGAVAGAAIGVVGSAMTSRGSGGSSTNGGAGTQTTDKSPWAAAQPWIKSNLAQGQALQNQYSAQPFSDLQNQAYQNQANQSAYMRAAVPSLLSQIQGQQVGFDRSNPNARPNAFSFDGLASAANAGQQAAQSQGLLSMLQSAPSTALNLNASAPAAAPAAPSKFVQQDASTDPMTQFYSALRGGGATGDQIQQGYGIGTPSGYTGSYGTFKYGDTPTPGTQAYYDQQQYFLYGGKDPYDLYGRADPGSAPYAAGLLTGGA